MLIETIQFKGHRCFKKNWAGFSELRKLNIIIGRNNSGKSHLLDLVARMCERQLHQENWQLYCSGVLDENTLKTVFAHNSHGGGLPGDHWIDHGKHLRATHVSWIITSENTIGEVTFKDPFAIKIGLPENSQTPGFVNARIEILRRGLIKATTPISGKLFRRLSSERDIQPEAASIQLALTSGGRGATNIIRRYITTADPEFPRDVIQKDLLHALNEVFGCDGQFTEVIVRHHDDKPPYGIANDTWEIFLGQEKKGPIALSRCGSGLKTVILVLLHLLVLHKIEKKAAGDYV
ncbi:MAG: hypothetical protein K0R17_1612, partial [Rariglobus sp.]|nr:hypothetical protein [Rariglobus sp.]